MATLQTKNGKNYFYVELHLDDVLEVLLVVGLKLFFTKLID